MSVYLKTVNLRGGKGGKRRLQGRHDVSLAAEGAIGHFVAEIP